MSINPDLLDAALDYMEEAIAADRAAGVKFAVIETRDNYLEFRTPLTPGWVQRLHGQMRKANQKTRLGGVVIMAYYKSKQEVVTAHVDDFNSFREGGHFIYATEGGVINREPYLELAKDEAGRLSDLLDHVTPT